MNEPYDDYVPGGSEETSSVTVAVLDADRPVDFGGEDNYAHGGREYGE